MKIKISLVIAIAALLILALTGCAAPYAHTKRDIVVDRYPDGRVHMHDASEEFREGNIASALPNNTFYANGGMGGGQVGRTVQTVQTQQPLGRPLLYTEPGHPQYQGPLVGPAVQFDAGVSFNTYGGGYPSTVWTPGYAQDYYQAQTWGNYHHGPRFFQPWPSPPPVGRNYPPPVGRHR